VLHDAQGKAFSAQQWQKIWSVVMVDAASCAELCQKQAHMLKQVHTLLNKDAKRVQRILLVPATANSNAISALQKQYPGLIVLAGADAETVSFAGNFNMAANGVYLVDPLGNLMMSYPANLEQKSIFADLKRLLKNSWAG
jgi:cytochrome oxidase Cu insertion factor (SCO1/SenC/PrrC family)